MQTLNNLRTLNYLLMSLEHSYFSTAVTVFKNLSWRFPRNPSTNQHVFVVGAPRSGTTLVQNIIRAHPSFFGIDGETAMFAWRNVFDRRRRHGGLAEDNIQELINSSRDIVEFFDALVKELREGTSRRFVDKSVAHVRHLPFLLKHFPESRVIHVFRDGRDCYCSARHHPNMSHMSLGDFARYWRTFIRARMRLQGQERIYDVRYEHLIASPEEAIRGAMNHLGVEYSPEQIRPENYGRDKRASEKVFEKLSVPIDWSNKEKWKAQLDDKQERLFWQIAHKELEALGYG